MEKELGSSTAGTPRCLLYHLKPAFVAQLKEEVAHLPVRVLELGDLFEF